MELSNLAREEYFTALRLWVQHANIYRNISTCFPYYLLSLGAPGAAASGASPLNNNYQPGWLLPPAPPPPPPVHRAPDQLSAAEVIARHGGYEYVVAPLHKRLAAELVDFVLLLVLKLAVTYVAVDHFHLIDVDSFDVEMLARNLEDYKLAIEITSEILILEFVYRIIVCFFEAWWLSRAAPGRRGGATPGKALLGLRVLSARVVLAVPGRARSTLLVHPAGTLSFPAALARSLLKNLLISLLFPVLVLLLVFHDRRMGYDVLCDALVVEDDPAPPRRNRP